MTDYIKIPSFPTQDLLRGVEAISPYPRINEQQPRREGYSQHQPDTDTGQDESSRRRFVSLRQLIENIKNSAKIIRVDYGSADAELRSIGLSIAEDMLIDQLLTLKTPLESIEQLLAQINLNRSTVTLGAGRTISSSKPTLFPTSTEGLTEYNLKIEELKIRSNQQSQIIEAINKDGLYVAEQDRLRLTFSRLGPSLGAKSELLKLKVSVLLGVIEFDDNDRRAIFYPRDDQNYCLYSDKLINLSI